LWVEHLETMEYTRSSVNLRAYGQREPLVEYKKEGLRLFKEMEAMFREQVASLITTMNIDQAILATENQTQVIESPQTLILNAVDSNDTPTIKNSAPKLGRNDPCFCGSGKKYKNCHGKS
jgi:preprotein translocase subunit SecA